MTLQGETILTGAPDTCPDCGIKPEFKVCHSAAGYYIGTECDCGPYSRESDYFATWKEADATLGQWDLGQYVGARTTEHKEGEFTVHTFDNQDDLWNFVNSCWPPVG